MALSLEKRVETALKTLIAAQVSGEQVLIYGDDTAAQESYTSVRVAQVAEDPPGTGIFALECTVTVHGDHTDDEIHTFQTLFNNSYALAASLRTAGSGSFVMPQGEAVELDGADRTSAGLDIEITFTFGCWAQTQEVSDAA